MNKRLRFQTLKPRVFTGKFKDVRRWKKTEYRFYTGIYYANLPQSSEEGR